MTRLYGDYFLPKNFRKAAGFWLTHAFLSGQTGSGYGVCPFPGRQAGIQNDT
jgi:hypothetical protein